MLEKEEMRREERRLSRRAALVETEQPFSFHTRDEQKKKEEEAAAAERARNRAKKFQKPFKAKDIPAAVKTPKLAALEEEARRRKEEARAAALAKLAEVKAPAAAEHKHGDVHDSASKKKQWSFKPAPMKPVPDFDALHDKFFRKLKSARASKPTTVPEEFRLHEKDAKAKAAELRKIKNDIRQDEHLPEVRWPFASLRAKVNSKPPPAFTPPSDDFLRKNETVATKLRRQAVVKARKEGHFSTKAEKEALEATQRDRDNRRRAAAWAKAQTDVAGKKALDFGRSSMRGGDQHTKARHAQQATLAKETVEKVLLETGVYTYVEEGSVV
jgi:protein FAM161A